MKKIIFIFSLFIVAISASAISLDDAEITQHFSPEWGKLISVEQTVTLNSDGDRGHFVPAYSFHFDRGYVLPMVEIDGKKVFGEAELDNGRGFNSVMYSLIEEKWVNAVARNSSEEYDSGLSWDSGSELLEVSIEFAIKQGVESVKR